MSAPTFRSVDQHTGTMAVTIREIDDMRTQLENARAELDDAMSQLRTVTESNAGLAKFANVYHTERDEQRERADEWRDKAESYLATIDCLECEITALKTALAAAESERDTYRAGAAL